MAKTISDLKTDIGDMLHGTSVEKIENFNDLVFRAAGDLLLEIDPAETIRIQQISSALYDQVFRYTIPTDLKGKAIIDIRPQTDRGVNDNPRQIFLNDFDLRKGRRSVPKFTLEFNEGVKTLKIDNPTLPAQTLINAVNDITDNGTWAVSGDASNLTQDTLTFLTGGASLRFDIIGTQGIITNSDMAEVDLSNEENIGAIFFWLYIPDKDTFTSVNIRWGSSSTTYWNRTLTTAQNSTAIQDGWNLFRANWDGATKTGSPDSENVDFIRIALNATTDTDYRLENITASRGTIYELVYYSKYLFKSEAGVWQEEPDNDSNIINLDTESFNLLVYKTMILGAAQIQGVDSEFDVGFYRRAYTKNVKLYRNQNPSEVVRPQSSWYRL